MYKQSWSIVIFCFNEVGTVRGVMDRTLALFDEHRGGFYEITVVDDGSTDGSHEKIVEVQRTRPDVIRVIRHEKNRGIGYALRGGYAAAKNENVVAVPADGQFDVRELLPHLNVEEGTFISFYRLENVQYTSFRNTLSAVNKYVNRFFNGIELKDVNWVVVFKRKSIVAFPWKMTSALIESEICAKLLLSGNRAIEVLSYYHPRRSGKSKGASPRIVFQAFRETLKLIWTVRQFKNSMSRST